MNADACIRTLMLCLYLGLFVGGDGFGMEVETDEGTIELYVWSEDTLPSNTTSTLVLSQEVLWNDKHTALPGVGSADITLTRGWVSISSHMYYCCILGMGGVWGGDLCELSKSYTIVFHYSLYVDSFTVISVIHTMMHTLEY